MKQRWEWVDDGLDLMFAVDPRLTEFDRTDLANTLGVTPEYASFLLQRHRVAQRSGSTRYVVAARGYARASRWYVLAAPGIKRGTRRRRALTMGHAEHVASDSARRIMADIRSELDPAVIQHPAITAFIAHAQAGLENAARSAFASVHAAVELVEQFSGETADRSGVNTP